MEEFFETAVNQVKTVIRETKTAAIVIFVAGIVLGGLLF